MEILLLICAFDFIFLHKKLKSDMDMTLCFSL